MPISPTYPGVYVEELESSVHTIVGVRTSVTAFIGRAITGIRNKAITIHSFEEYMNLFGGLSKDSNMSYAVYHYFLNGGQDAIIVAIDDDAGYATFKREKDKESVSVDPDSPVNMLEFTAYKPGDISTDISIFIEKNKFNSDLLNLYVKRYYSEKDYVDIPKVEDKVGRWLKESPTLESFYNLSLSPTSSRFVYDVLQQTSNYIRKTSTGPVLGAGVSLDNCLGLYLTKDTGLDPTVSKIDDKKVIPEIAGSKEGIHALDDADIFNILCIPPFSYNSTTKTDEDVSTSVYSDALKYCEERRAILIVDPPSNWTTKQKAIENVDAAGTGLGSLRHKNAAIFFPRILAHDRNNENRLREFVPCGFIAGVMARTDIDRGVWKAPAGIQATIMGANDLTVRLTDPENGELNPIAINCLRLKPPAGIVVWGSRTMRGADQLTDQWKYLPIRRLALYIEESLYRGTQWVVFEPNDERLWSQIRLNVDSFMHDLFTKGAFQGSTPKEAYLVKCDHETTTQLDIDRGIVNIVIGFAPLKPAEFVMLKIEQLAGQTAEAKA